MYAHSKNELRKPPADLVNKPVMSKVITARKTAVSKPVSVPVSNTLSYASAALGGRRRTVSEGSPYLSALVEVIYFSLFVSSEVIYSVAHFIASPCTT